MFYTTRGIVFQSFKYSESSIIAKVFTEEFGLQSYMVKGVRSKRSRFRPALFQPLTLVELVDILITYYRLHLPGFGEMKSLEVLKTILA